MDKKKDTLQKRDLIQMDTGALSQYIKNQLLENPLLETVIPYHTSTDRAIEDRQQKIQWLDNLNADARISHPMEEEENSPLLLEEDLMGESLEKTLYAQMLPLKLSSDVEKTLFYVIENLDENGYISSRPEEICEELSISETTLQEATTILQTFDPVGVGARNLEECLLLQAKKNYPEDDVLQKIILHHLDLIAKGHSTQIAERLGVSTEEVEDSREHLLTLNPRPGNGYADYRFTPYIVPDVLVVHFSGNFEIVVNEYLQPQVQISQEYEDENLLQDKEARKFLEVKKKEAQDLIDGIQLRKTLLLKCTEEILSFQRDFFVKGPGYLLPLSLEQVAEAGKIPLSKLEKLIPGKYLQCQWGVFQLETFFLSEL